MCFVSYLFYLFLPHGDLIRVTLWQERHCTDPAWGCPKWPFLFGLVQALYGNSADRNTERRNLYVGRSNWPSLALGLIAPQIASLKGQMISQKLSATRETISGNQYWKHWITHRSTGKHTCADTCEKTSLGIFARFPCFG